MDGAARFPGPGPAIIRAPGMVRAGK